MNPDKPAKPHHLRFLHLHEHLAPVFGDDWFGRKAERFARFFGTPTFLIAQTGIVGIWIVANLWGSAKFDPYPFILLNLAFSLQAAYAAPMILLAQTREADRDKALAETDARHREELAEESKRREEFAAETSLRMLELLKQNTELTALTKEMSERIEVLTKRIHERMGDGG